ncbi:Protein chibby 1 [Chamberlinius hualienensis]
MPLFPSKFNSRKTTPRKSLSVSTLHQKLGVSEIHKEFGEEIDDKIVLRLGEIEGRFENGQWKTAASDRKTTSLMKLNDTLTKENNLLKLKVEILLDMMAETTIESHLQAKEIEDLKKKLKFLQQT